MSDFTRTNLKDVKDSAVEFGHAPGLEARFAREALGLQATGISYQRFASGFEQPFAHRHARDEEVYVVLSGRGQMRLDDELIELQPLDAVRVAPGTMRTFVGGFEPLEILAFGQHSDDPGEVVPTSDESP